MARQPLTQANQWLHLLIAAAMTVGQHAEVMLLPWLAAAAQAHRAAKGAPFTEAK